MPTRHPRRCTPAELEQIAAFVAAGRVTICPAMACAPTSAVTPEKAAEAMDRVLAQWEADAARRRDEFRAWIFGG